MKVPAWPLWFLCDYVAIQPAFNREDYWNPTTTTAYIVYLNEILYGWMYGR